MALGFALVHLNAQAQQEAFTPPTSSYDTPERVILPLENAGEIYQFTLGEPRKNAWSRMVRLKLLGLEEINRLTALKKEVGQNEKADKKPAEESSGGFFGGLMNAMTRGKIDAQKESAKDDLIVHVVEANSPEDQPGTAIADVFMAPDAIHGSIFGAKIGNKVKVSVSSPDFHPKVLVMRRYLSQGKLAAAFGAESSNRKPVYKVVADAESDGMGTEKIIVTFDRSSKSADSDASKGIVIAVTSEDGKAVTGKYSIKYYKD